MPVYSFMYLKRRAEKSPHPRIVPVKSRFERQEQTDGFLLFACAKQTLGKNRPWKGMPGGESVYISCDIKNRFSKATN